jgi:uncharacterized protein (TIGR02231 family)
MKRLVISLAACGLACSFLSPTVLAQVAGTPTSIKTAAPFAAAGVIESVTVYRGQALVTRRVEIPAGAAGVSEIVVSGLPARLQAASLHAEGEGLTVQSVRYRTRPVPQDVREEVREVDARIADLEQKLGANARRTELITENRAYLTGLQQFVAPTATAELTRGVLNADTIEKLTTFMIKQRESFADAELRLGAEARQLRADLELAQRERQKLTSGSQRTESEAVVLVARDVATPVTLRLRYLVDNATWTPSYNVRTERGAGAARDSLTLDYYASVSQLSGEDWSGVAMTLSTATPSLVAKAPALEPLSVALGGEPGAAQSLQQSEGYWRAREELSRKQRDVEQQRANRVDAGKGKDDASFDKFMNINAADMQVLDLVANERVQRQEKSAASAREEGLSVTYTIPGRATLPSRADRQQIQIASLPMPAEFTKLATPVLTGYVYDEARSVNASGLVLLAGPVTGYADGAFVGGGDLPTVAAGESFTVGFGIDSALRTSREVVERTESIQGGNRVVDLTYRVSVENFGSAPASVRLLDRLPKASDSQIKVTMVSSSQALCDIEEYVQGPRKDGILRWDVTVPANSAGGRSFSVEYKFRLEYDKQMSLVGLGG